MRVAPDAASRLMSAPSLNHRCVGCRALLAGALALSAFAGRAFAAASTVAASTVAASMTGASMTGASADAPAKAALFAAPIAHQAVPGQAGSLMRVTVALIVVLAAVFAAAWFSRRMHGVGSSRSSTLQVIAQLPLGPRERAVLVRVGAEQVLLGVASGNVRALHVLPAGATSLQEARAVQPAQLGQSPGTDAPTGGTMPADPMPRPTFKSMLLRSLGK